MESVLKLKNKIPFLMACILLVLVISFTFVLAEDRGISAKTDVAVIEGFKDGEKVKVIIKLGDEDLMIEGAVDQYKNYVLKEVDEEELRELEESGLYRRLRIITSHQDAHVIIGGKRYVSFSSKNQ